MAMFNKINQNAQSVTIPKKLLQSYVYKYELTKTEYRLLIFLFTVLDTNNYTYVNIDKVAMKIGVPPKKARKALNGLLGVSIIAEGSDEYCDCGYRFVIDK